MRSIGGVYLLLYATCVFILDVTVAQIIQGFANAVPKTPDTQLEVIMHWNFVGVNGMFPIQLRFSPNSNHVMVIFKQGYMRLYESINADVNDFVADYDIGPECYDSFDHGLTSFVFDPDFPQTLLGYILYSADASFVGDNDTPYYPNPNVALQNLRNDWGNAWPYYYCPSLGAEVGESTPENPGNYEGQFCEHWARVGRITFTENSLAFSKTANVITGGCGGSSTHGTGALAFAADGSLTFGSGDNAMYQTIDPGMPNDDGCYDPTLGMPQGSWRSQRDEFMHGKIISILQDDYRFGENLEDTGNFGVVAKGFRNPFRHYVKNDGAIYVGDVGYGDGTLTERIYHLNIGGTEENLGWPCNEGVRPYPWQSQQDADRKQYTIDNNYDVCNAVYNAIDGTDGADENWQAPIFEYRSDPVDPQNPICLTGLASITAVYVYEGIALAEEYQGGLFFSDHTQKCMWYWPKGGYPTEPTDPNDPNATPMINPKLFLSNNGFVDIAIDPSTGIMYLTDLNNVRVTRIYSTNGVIETPAPTEPIDPPPVNQIQMCSENPYSIEELEWENIGEDRYAASITFDAVRYETPQGETITRAYDQRIPAKIIRMKPCAVYELTLTNTLTDWVPLFPPQAEPNNYRDPGITNLHLHGLHISGTRPGDDQSIEILPGDSYTYTYVIPCDHMGGTHWYHAHHHGSTTLHSGGGAAGVLIVEDNPITEVGMPEELKSLGVKGKEAVLFFSEVNVPAMDMVSTLSEDPIWFTDESDSYYLINGCDINAFEMELTAGEWTRVRMLHQANSQDLVVDFFSNAEENQCQVGVIAKDGIYLSEIPRMLDPLNLKVYMTIASRVDVILKCNVAGEYIMTGYQRLWMNIPRAMGIIRVIEGNGYISPDLPTWHPCRPAYLHDLRTVPLEVTPKIPFNLYVRNTINDELYEPGRLLPIDTSANKIQEWVIEGTSSHPFHAHVNHMQLQDDEPSNYDEVPNWHKSGDIIDTISYADTRATVRLLNDRYGGTTLMHCHVYTHSDVGVVAAFNIKDGYGPLGTPAIISYGSCPYPPIYPYSDLFTLPYVIPAAFFDQGGESQSYHNVYLPVDRPLNPIRLDSGVEIGLTTDDISPSLYEIANVYSTEWLSYSIYAPKNSEFIMLPRIKGTPGDFDISVKIDLNDCDSLEGEISRWTYENWEGSYDEFTTLEGRTVTFLTGKHILTICFNTANDFSFSSLSVLEKIEQTPYRGTPVSFPGTIQMYQFDFGGQGISYNDVNENNKVISQRPEDTVEIIESLGNGFVVYNLAAGEWLSYSVNILEPGEYTLGFEIAFSDAEIDGISLSIKLDDKNCDSNKNVIFEIDVPNVDFAYFSPNFSRYFATETAQISKDLLGLRALTLCVRQVPLTLSIASITFSLNGRPEVIPYNEVEFEIPGTIIASEFDKTLVNFPGEGVTYHNVYYNAAEANNLYREDTTIEFALDDNTMKYFVGNIYPTEWLIYSVVFSELGEHHMGLELAGMPVPATLHIVLKLGNSECADPDNVLLESYDLAYPGTGGLNQFAIYNPQQTFQVTEEMLNFPQALKLCFSDTPEAGIQLLTLTFALGIPPPPAQRTCYLELCQNAPGVTQAENYDKGGESVGYHNLIPQITPPLNDARPLEGVETRLKDLGNFVVDTIIANEWLSYSIQFSNQGVFVLEIGLSGNLDLNAVNGGIAFSFQLDSIDCADNNATIAKFDDPEWNFEADTIVISDNVLVTEGEHLVTLCWVRLPAGGEVEFDSFSFF